MAILIVASGVCMIIAQRMAQNRARSPKLWVLAAAFLGPLPLAVLALLPSPR
jgi:hypothetical protein